MQTNFPYPTFRNPPWILDVCQTLPTLPIEVPTIASVPSALTLRASIPPLAFLLLADRLGELYEMAFPNHPEWLNELVDWENEEAIIGAAERFLGRVNTLFPVHDDIWDIDLEVIEWRLYEIPVIPMGFDYWYDGWDDFKEPIPYLLHMVHSRGDEDSSPVQDEFADEYPHHLVPRYLEPHRLVDILRATCAEQGQSMTLPESLNALPDLIEMLHHATGNAWLDVGEYALAEGGGYPQWTAEDVAWLTEEWRKAMPVWDGVNRLLDWQNGSPDEIEVKLTAVREVLLEAYQLAQQTEAV